MYPQFAPCGGLAESKQGAVGFGVDGDPRRRKDTKTLRLALAVCLSIIELLLSTSFY